MLLCWQVIVLLVSFLFLLEVASIVHASCFPRLLIPSFYLYLLSSLLWSVGYGVGRFCSALKNIIRRICEYVWRGLHRIIRFVRDAFNYVIHRLCPALWRLLRRILDPIWRMIDRYAIAGEEAGNRWATAIITVCKSTWLGLLDGLLKARASIIQSRVWRYFRHIGGEDAN